jgi:hypothetical protein
MPWWGWVLIGIGVIAIVIIKVVVGRKFLQKMQERKMKKAKEEEVLDE